MSETLCFRTDLGYPAPPPSIKAQRAQHAWCFRHYFNSKFNEAEKSSRKEVPITEEEIFEFFMSINAINGFDLIPDKNLDRHSFEAFRSRVNGIRTSMNKAARMGNHNLVPPFSIDWRQGKYRLRIIERLADVTAEEAINKTEKYIVNQLKLVEKELTAWQDPEIKGRLPLSSQIKLDLYPNTVKLVRELMGFVMRNANGEVNLIRMQTKQLTEVEEREKVKALPEPED